MDIILMRTVLTVAAVAVIATLAGSFFTVHTQHAAIIERFGKFRRVAEAGLNFKAPFVEAARIISLETFQLDGEIETKTKDNVFVKLPVSVQYRVIDRPQSIADSYYKLTNTKAQIESYLYNILLAHIPETALDDVFLTQPQIAQRATQELSAEMLPFGYEIVKVLITDIVPDEGVKAAMNRINEQTRLAVANKAQGDAEYVLRVRQAEADAEVKRLEGVGLAQEREAIATGWSKALADVKNGTDMTDTEATLLLLFTNWTDMLRDVGTTKNTTMVFMPSGPEGLKTFQSTMQNMLLERVASATERMA